MVNDTLLQGSKCDRMSDLRILKEENQERFIKDMQEAFQKGAESGGEASDKEVLPAGDIDEFRR